MRRCVIEAKIEIVVYINEEYNLDNALADNVRITSDDFEILEIENHNIIEWNFK
jgi:hypothetical protein